MENGMGVGMYIMIPLLLNVLAYGVGIYFVIILTKYIKLKAEETSLNIEKIKENKKQ